MMLAELGRLCDHQERMWRYTRPIRFKQRAYMSERQKERIAIRQELAWARSAGYDPFKQGWTA